MRKLPTKVSKGVAGKKLDVAKYSRLVKPTQRLRRLTILWVQPSGEPFNTSGFFATASTLSGRLIQTARFDGFGVVQFSRIRTPINRDIVIRTFDRNGVLFRTRTVPADNAAFAIIG